MQNPYKGFDEYGIRYLLTHLIQAEEWEGLEQVFADTDFIEIKCTAGMSYELIVACNEAILRIPAIFPLLESIWNGLSADHPELLQPLLHRFLYVATVPDQRILKLVPKEHEIEISSQVRVPHPTYWPPMVQFLDGHRNEVIVLAPNQIATIAEKWLVQNQSSSYQKEAAELGLAVAWRVFHEIQQKYSSKTADPKIAYRAALASVPMLPERAIEFVLTACGRQEPPPLPSELLESAKPLPERDPNLPTPPLGSIFPEVEIPPWPDGPRWRIDRDFQDLCLNEPDVLMPLMALRPEIAREVILALLIREPGRRLIDWKHNDFERDYEISDELRDWPPFYTHGPFQFFLSINPEIGLGVILRLVNFATARWKDRWEEQPDNIPSVTIPFPEDHAQWFGERWLYTTYRDATQFPDVIICALMALEHWFYTNLDNEESITEAITTILQHTQSLAFAGVLVGIGKKHPQLFRGPLKPFLAVPEFYQWELMHQIEGERHQLMGWQASRHTEYQIQQAHQWHTMPHRKLELSTVARSLFLHDEDIRAFFENVREQWRIRLQNSEPDDPLYDRLAKLIREFDVNNWQQEEHPKYGALWRFQPPKEFLEILEREYPQFLDQKLLLLFPFQCWQRLNNNQALQADELEDFWTTLQRIEQFTDDQLEDFYQFLQHKESFTPDDPNVGKRQVRDSLCAGVAVLIQFHRDWLRKHPDKEEWCIRMMTETLQSPPPHSPLDSEASVSVMNWDNFCAYAIPILWAEDPTSEFWRNLVAWLVIQPHYNTAKILFLQAVKYRQQLGDDFLRLQHLILRWAWARWHLRYPVAKENERQQKGRSKKVSKKFDKVAKKFIRGSLSINSPSWEKLAAEPYKRPCQVYKTYYVPRSPGLDRALIRHAFDGLPLLAEVRDHDERQRIITFWQEALNCVLGMLGHGDEEIKEIERTPGDFERWVFEKIVCVILQLHPFEDQQQFWKPILNLGTPAHYWIESFLLHWFLYGLASNQYQEVFIQAWKEMLDFAFTSSKWDYNPERGHHHQLDALWYRLMGIDGSFLHLWNEQKTAVVNEMRNYYERWASSHLFQGDNTSAFIAFLQTPAAKDICLDGLLWLDQAASETKTDFKYERESLVGLLTFYWQNHQIALRQYSAYWTAFKNSLDRLVRQGNNRALALSEIIPSETNR